MNPCGCTLTTKMVKHTECLSEYSVYLLARTNSGFSARVELKDSWRVYKS